MAIAHDRALQKLLLEPWGRLALQVRLSLALLLLAGAAGPAWGLVNDIDKPVAHPAIPLLDEAGSHVLDSGKPYSPKTSCMGSGCHDYDAISHGQHFEMGRDEADDNFGAKRGPWSQVVSPGYFGGLSCMGPQILAKRKGADNFLGDFGAAGMVKACIQCHTGGGWSEKDRTGTRYDQKAAAAISALDGDYYNRGTGTGNQPIGASYLPAYGGWKDAGLPLANSATVSRWDWKKSGVVENDCFMCHGDYSQLTIFPESGIGTAKLPTDRLASFDMKETPANPFIAWWTLRNQYLIGQGFFREGATALLEFLPIKPADNPTAADACERPITRSHPVCLPDEILSKPMQLVNFQRSNGNLKPVLDEAGNPAPVWNASAFSPAPERKVVIQMRRFPANDNCWQCHGNTIDQDRRGFWGFGVAALGRLGSYKADVHKGKAFTENNDEVRYIENCEACHTQGIYYSPGFVTADLNANHNYPKGHSDVDVRRDLDNRPGPKSCEYCHDQATYKIIPSGHPTLLAAHRELWKAEGFLDGYPKDTLTKVTQTHLDVVSCQACHINGLKDFKGNDLDLFYRYRRAEDGKLKIVPTVDDYQFRYFWRDKKSGRVLRQGEMFSVYTPKRDEAGKVVAGVLKDPETGTQYELPGTFWVPFTKWYGNFPADQTYAATRALKRSYDRLLKQQGYADPDVQLVWMQGNSYLVSHNTRSSTDSVPCEDCHNRKQNGSFSSLVSYQGLFGEGNVKVLTDYTDQRLVDEGVVVLGEPYLHVSADNKIIANMSEVLFDSKKDPSMSALKSESAKVAVGEWSKAGLAETLKRMRLASSKDRLAVSKELAGVDVFEFSLEAGDARLRSMAVASGVDAVGAAVLPHYRLEMSVADLSADQQQAIDSLGLKPASDVFALSMVSESKKVATDFIGQKVLVKLPYRGTETDPAKVKIVGRHGGAWQDEGITPTVISPPPADNGEDLLGDGSTIASAAGYVVFSAPRPFAALAVTEVKPTETPTEPGTDPGTDPGTGNGQREIPTTPDPGTGTDTPATPVNPIPSPAQWRTVQPQASCVAKSCQASLKKARTKLRNKALLLIQAQARAARRAAKAAAETRPVEKARLELRASKAATKAAAIQQAFEQAVLAVQGLHD